MGEDFHHDGEGLQTALWNRWKLSRNARRPSWRLLHLGKDLCYMSDDISLMLRFADFFIFWFVCRLFMATFAYQHLSLDGPRWLVVASWRREKVSTCLGGNSGTLILALKIDPKSVGWIGKIYRKPLVFTIKYVFFFGSNFPVDQSNDKSARFDAFPFVWYSSVPCEMIWQVPDVEIDCAALTEKDIEDSWLCRWEHMRVWMNGDIHGYPKMDGL